MPRSKYAIHFKSDFRDMSDVIFKTRVDDFLARRVKDIIRQGSFRDEDAFFREAIKEMVRMHELRELDKRMDAFARKAAADQLMDFSDAVLAARAEEDNELKEGLKSYFPDRMCTF